MRLIDENGNQVGIMRTQDALRYAQERDLDLVEVAPEAKPPVCRVLDYSKYKYEQNQKQKAARKHQTQINVREIKFRPKIAQHDYDTKKGHVERFLKSRDKVKVTIMFRGREMAHPERGEMILNRLAEDLGELAVIEQRPQQDGRNMTMMLAPTAKAGTRRAPDAKRKLRPREAAEPSAAAAARPGRPTRPRSSPTRSSSGTPRAWRTPPPRVRPSPFRAAASASSPEMRGAKGCRGGEVARRRAACAPPPLLERAPDRERVARVLDVDEERPAVGRERRAAELARVCRRRSPRVRLRANSYDVGRPASRPTMRCSPVPSSANQRSPHGVMQMLSGASIWCALDPSRNSSSVLVDGR